MTNYNNYLWYIAKLSCSFQIPDVPPEAATVERTAPATAFSTPSVSSLDEPYFSFSRSLPLSIVHCPGVARLSISWKCCTRFFFLTTSNGRPRPASLVLCRLHNRRRLSSHETRWARNQRQDLITAKKISSLHYFASTIASMTPNALRRNRHYRFQNIIHSRTCLSSRRRMWYPSRRGCPWSRLTMMRWVLVMKTRHDKLERPDI